MPKVTRRQRKWAAKARRARVHRLREQLRAKAELDLFEQDLEHEQLCELAANRNEQEAPMASASPVLGASRGRMAAMGIAMAMALGVDFGDGGSRSGGL